MSLDPGCPARQPRRCPTQAWLLETYGTWGVPARTEQYGTWLGWQQGILHVDLTAPRVQSLEAKLPAYSAGTSGPVEGEVVAVPTVVPSDFDVSTWLPLAEGKWLLLFPPEPTCRPPESLARLARPETVESLQALREENATWASRFIDGMRGQGVGLLNESGALGLIQSSWAEGWGVFRIEDALTGLEIPDIALSCEDYGLVYRLAEHDQNPRLRIEAQVEQLGDVPQFNVIAELTGTELPDEHVFLSAHLDSHNGATGAIDNGTGTIMMLEAMRILQETYPNPRRTIRVGHWGGEELSGALGSRAYREDHPEVVDGLQALFNQDNGTWRIERIEGQGFLHAGQFISRWISQVPRELSERITLEFPGGQDFPGSDHTSFLCAGAPAFRLDGARDEHETEYRLYEWHTNRDTYDKIVFDDLKGNATLAAMLAYAASEDPDRVPRDRAMLPTRAPRRRNNYADTGEPREWVRCRPPRRAY